MDKNFVTIQGFMLDFGLSSTELIIYAIIYGFSQSNQGVFWGSRAYLAKWTGCTLPTVDKALKTLQKKNLITKAYCLKDNQKIPFYSVVSRETLEQSQPEQLEPEQLKQPEQLEPEPFSLSAEQSGAEADAPEWIKDSVKKNKAIWTAYGTWKAYKEAYNKRYSVNPLRNAKVNKIISNIVKEVGEIAPEIVGFYVTHNNEYFLEKKHDIAVLLKNLQLVVTDYHNGTITTKSRVYKWVKENDNALQDDDQYTRLINRMKDIAC